MKSQILTINLCFIIIITKSVEKNLENITNSNIFYKIICYCSNKKIKIHIIFQTQK